MTLWEGIHTYCAYVSFRSANNCKAFAVDCKRSAINLKVGGGTNRLKWDAKAVTLIPVIGINIRTRLQWFKHRGAFFATYSDIYGHQYTSICVENQHEIFEGDPYPHLKPEQAIWEVLKKQKNKMRDLRNR